jgi:hypothetical protein
VRLPVLYAAVWAAVAAPPPARFAEHTIATDLKGGYQVVVADLNRDGKPDLIALASGMKELVWFENPGWQRHVLATGQNRMINCAYLPSGEIVLASEFAMEAKNSAGIVSVLRPGGDPRQPWTVTEIDRFTTSHRLRVADTAIGRIVVNAPLTGATATAPEYRGQTPLVFYRPGEWKRQVISEENSGVVHGIWVVDWDGDRKDEILTASFSGIHLFRPASDGRWTRTEVAQGDPAPWPKSGSSDVAVGRIGKSKFLAAIEPWHGNEVVVYRRKGKEWVRRVIDDSMVDGHTIITADLDGDGTDEIVAGYRGKGRSVHVYRWDGGKWSRQALDGGGMAAAACAAADLNGDGRVDVACIGSATSNLKWYESLR